MCCTELKLVNFSLKNRKYLDMSANECICFFLIKKEKWQKMCSNTQKNVFEHTKKVLSNTIFKAEH